jgi:hypothetical protein
VLEITSGPPVLALDAFHVARALCRHTKPTTTATSTSTKAREAQTPAKTPALMPEDSGVLGGGEGSSNPELNGRCEGSTSCTLRGGMPVAIACAYNVHPLYRRLADPGCKGTVKMLSGGDSVANHVAVHDHAVCSR